MFEIVCGDGRHYFIVARALQRPEIGRMRMFDQNGRLVV
jgi:hypothetical protein